MNFLQEAKPLDQVIEIDSYIAIQFHSVCLWKKNSWIIINKFLQCYLAVYRSFTIYTFAFSKVNQLESNSLINDREYLRSPCYVHLWSEPAFAPRERIVWYLRTENSFYVNAEFPLFETSATKMEAYINEEATYSPTYCLIPTGNTRISIHQIPRSTRTIILEMEEIDSFNKIGSIRPKS